MNYDIFNGDADGICALHQLRLANPKPTAQLVTGVKRDIRLLTKIAEAKDASITVLDISMDSNKQDLLALLNNNCSVFYADHHFAGSIPDSPNLEAHIDTDPNICTSLIADQQLNGKFRAWAIAGAFGDNLHDAARHAAEPLLLSPEKLNCLQDLGELLNYNGYGNSLEDLHFHPQLLYESLRPFDDPFSFYEKSNILEKLKEGYNQDMLMARNTAPIQENTAGRIYKLPAQSWAKRAIGVFSNEKAREEPDLAHAILIENPDQSFRVSVRAPLNNKINADTLCLSFPTGGGRAAAAGINELKPEMLTEFLTTFKKVFNQ